MQWCKQWKSAIQSSSRPLKRKQNECVEFYIALFEYLYTASVSRQIKSEDHQSEDGLFDEENEAVCSFIAEALL